MSNRPLVRGDIVKADVCDPQGRNPKVRPLVVLEPPTPETPNCIVVFVSGTKPDSVDGPFCVELPYDSDLSRGRKRGHRKTKLYKPSWAYCNRLYELTPNEVIEIDGYCPGTYLVQIATIVDGMKPRPLHLKAFP